VIPQRNIEGIVFPDYERIAPADWHAHLEQAIERANQSQSDIVGNAEPPDFENTFLALQKRWTQLNQTVMPFVCSQGANATDEMNDLAKIWVPALTTLEQGLLQDAVIFQRCSHAYENRKNWTPAQERLAVSEMHEFKMAGAGLDEGDRKQLMDIEERLALLGVEIQEMITKEAAKTIVFDREQLKGLDDAFLAEAANGREDGRYVVELKRTNIDKVAVQCVVRDTRKLLWQAFGARNEEGENATGDMIQEMLALRQQEAALLGFARFSDMELSNTMAKTPEAATALVMSTWKQIQPALERDMAMVREKALAAGITDIQPWDVPYFTERVRAERYAVDDEVIRNYLPLSVVQAAAFETARKIFGVRINKANFPTYHSDCESWMARDEASGQAIGGLITDYIIRDTKGQGPGWM
jgi:peptidyl-dipeptidase Dcp